MCMCATGPFDTVTLNEPEPLHPASSSLQTTSRNEASGLQMPQARQCEHRVSHPSLLS